MKFFQGSFPISFAFVVIICGYFSFSQADTTAIEPLLDRLFAEWLKKQQTDETMTEAVPDPVQNSEQPLTDSVTPANVPDPGPGLAVPQPQPQPLPSFNPFLPPFAPNPFLPQVAPAPNPALPPYLDPALNPYAYYPYLSPFGPFPLKIKKKKV